MTEPKIITTERAEAYKKLCDGATDGPWEQEDGTYQIWGGEGKDVPLVKGCNGYRSWGRLVEHEEHDANAAFIATAREALPDALYSLEQAREAIRVLLTMQDSGSKPRKLDEALSWRDNDLKAREMALAALGEKEGG